MKLPERVTEDFIWNDLYSSYSKGTRVFLEWFNEYKKETNWDSLFNAGYVLNRDYKIGHMVDPGKTKSPHFSDLPHAMQLGIWLFFLEDQEIYTDMDVLGEKGLREHMRQGVMAIELDNMP